MRHRTCYAVQAPSLLVVHAPSQTDILGVRHLSPGRRAHPLSFSHRQLTCTRRNGLPSRHPCVIDLSSMGVCPRRRPCHTQNPRHPQHGGTVHVELGRWRVGASHARGRTPLLQHRRMFTRALVQLPLRHNESTERSVVQCARLLLFSSLFFSKKGE